jgi:predicted short-subunit dehydrogenase-like oxidoreductase (DUF2520 family)
MGMQSVSIIGVGRIGGALAIALSRSGFEIKYLIHRDPSKANVVSELLPPGVKRASGSASLPELESDIVLVTTADPDIVGIAHRLRDRMKPGTVVLHTSGSLSSDVFSELASSGYHTGSMHPLVSVSDAVSGADNFSNAFFCIEGDELAVATARSLVEYLDGRPFSIASNKKPLYHAAAVTACGHLVALVDIAIEMLSKCGVERHSAQEILLPLITSTVNNLQTQTPERALTGSFARLDSTAVERHLSAIDQEMSDRVREVYLLLGERSLDLAAENAGSEADEQRLREVISIAKRKSG